MCICDTGYNSDGVACNGKKNVIQIQYWKADTKK